jgi:hypothetical protein
VLHQVPWLSICCIALNTRSFNCIRGTLPAVLSGVLNREHKMDRKCSTSLKKNETSQDLTVSGYDQMARLCENGNEPLGSIRAREYIYQLSNYRLLKDGCASRSQLFSVSQRHFLVFHVFVCPSFSYYIFIEYINFPFLWISDIQKGGRDAKNEVLRRTNRLPSFERARTAKETTRPTFILLLRVFIAAGTCFPSRCLATIVGIHMQTHTLMGDIYEIRRWDGLRCHDTHTKFHEDWFRHSKVDGGIHRHTDSKAIS